MPLSRIIHPPGQSPRSIPAYGHDMTVKTATKSRKTVKGQPVRTPLWKGPFEDGITFSLLVKFLECRERFRLLVVEGLKDDEGFPEKMEYGSMFHLCEEHYRQGKRWESALKAYCLDLKKKYPEHVASIEKWDMVCRTQFPIYCEVWADHEMDSCERYAEEQSFVVPYTLSSGRTITLRGKIDGMLYDESGCLLLQENKTKGRLNEDDLAASLFGDLQTMFYQTAARQMELRLPIGGVWYNVLRRPLEQFQPHCIKQKKGESSSQFFARLEKEIRSDPDHFFIRWKTIIDQTDVDSFRQRTLDPILEQLCDWWEYISSGPGPFEPWAARFRGTASDMKFVPPIHWQSPWGVYNSLAIGTRGSYFNLLTTGRRNGLVTTDNLFPELT